MLLFCAIFIFETLFCFVLQKFSFLMKIFYVFSVKITISRTFIKIIRQ